MCEIDVFFSVLDQTPAVARVPSLPRAKSLLQV